MRPEERVAPLRSLAGWTGDAENYIWSEPVLTGLLGDESLSGLTYLSITRTRLEPRQRALLDAAAVALVQPDPRVPPLKVARMLATRGGVAVGLCAGILAVDRARIGPWAIGEAAKLLSDLCAPRGALLEQLRARFDCGRVAGFGVPLKSVDPRVVPLQAQIEALGHHGEHWTAHRQAADAVAEWGGPPPNVGLPVGALLLDLGVPAANAALLALGLMLPNFLANVVEASEQAHPAYTALPASNVRYVGVAPRQSPQARIAGGSGNEDEA